MSEIHPALAQGNVAVVTGGANGIGLAAARRFLGFGMKVCIVDADAGQLAQVLPELGPDAIGKVVDVSDRRAVEALACEVEGQLGPVSVLMNNAGTGGGGDALTSPEGWQRVLGVNLFGVVNGTQAFGPAMAARDAPGLIVNTGSKQGITSPPGDTAYNVSKAGVRAFTEGLAHTLRNREGCRVTAHLLIPGFTYTGMMKKWLPEKPAGAWDPEQVADAMIAGLARGDFYLWCLDNETTRKKDEKRVLWGAMDITENRPALSRWDPAWKDAFERFMGG
ncbi:MAG TPA: SDR family NAD(P)-dependent oxidoreductase [Novosphingobium sp.]|nr:SDR family NAD(P)-dependent oxidoreductase [Novosphingobium sp.]